MLTRSNMAKNNKTRFFYVLYSDKKWVFDRSERAKCPIYILVMHGNGTEWSPIRSPIRRVITKSDDHTAKVRFVYHDYDYRPNWTIGSLITN